MTHKPPSRSATQPARSDIDVRGITARLPVRCDLACELYPRHVACFLVVLPIMGSEFAEIVCADDVAGV